MVRVGDALRESRERRMNPDPPIGIPGGVWGRAPRIGPGRVALAGRFRLPSGRHRTGERDPARGGAWSESVRRGALASRLGAGEHEHHDSERSGRAENEESRSDEARAVHDPGVCLLSESVAGRLSRATRLPCACCGWRKWSGFVRTRTLLLSSL